MVSTLEFLDEEYALTMKKRVSNIRKVEEQAEHNDYITPNALSADSGRSIEAVETGRCSAEYTKVKWKYCPRWFQNDGINYLIVRVML